MKNFTIESTLRNLKPIPAFAVRWLYPLMRRDDTLDPSKLKQPAKGGRTASYSSDMLLDHLPKKGATTTDWQRRTCEETGMSRGKFFDLSRSLATSGAITKDTKGKWQKVTSPESPE